MKKPAVIVLTWSFCLLVLADCQTAPTPAVRTNHEVLHGIVARIVDGDTLIVVIGQKQERVRLRNENAPELDEPGGPEAKIALEKRFPVGCPVSITVYARDVYARIVATVKRRLPPTEPPTKPAEAPNGVNIRNLTGGH